MERNGYYMSLRNPKKYSQYPSEFDEMNSNNGNKMDNFLERNIYNNYNMIDKRKKPLVLTPKIILNNNNYSNNNNNIAKINQTNPINNENGNNNIKKFPSDTSIFKQNTNINNKDKIIINEPSLKDEYIRMDEEDIYLPTIHWKYDGPTGLNTEKKHFPRKKNIGNFFKINSNNNSVSVKLNSSEHINNNINNYELNSNYDNINTDNNRNIFNNNEYYYRNNKYNNNYFDDKNNINNQNRSKSNDTVQNPFSYDNTYRRNNLYRSEEKPESLINKYNKDRINKMINYNNINSEEIDKDRDMDMDMDDYNGNKKYKYYNPKRYDYRGSRYGDYTYNYYLNAPMRGDKTRSWKYPPLYYINSYINPYK